jgi:hypothetical protein
VTPVEHLNYFAQRVEQLQQLRIFDEGNWRSSFTLNWDRAKGMTLGAKQPDEELFRSFLLEFRRFITQGPRGDQWLWLPRVFNTAHQNITSEQLRGFLVEAREHWTRATRSGDIALVWNDKPMPPAEIADLWINGWYFHDDPAKRDFLSRLRGWERWVVRMHFVNFVTECARITCYAGHVIRVALREDQVKR